MKNLIAILVLLSTSSTVFAATCKPFMMSIGVAGYEISFSKACIDQSASTLEMIVSTDGKSVGVDSGTLTSPDVDVKKAIAKRMTEGLSQADASAIVNTIGPALKSGDSEKAKIALIDLILSDK